MKNIKIFLLAAAIILPFFQSCEFYEPQSAALVTTRATDASNFYFELANGQKIFVAERGNLTTDYIPVDGERVILSFTILDKTTSGYDYSVKLYGVERLLTKEIVTLTDPVKDTLGHDAIDINSLNSSGGYINIEYKIYTKGYILHGLNLVDNQTVENNSDKTILELRHFANNDTTGDEATGVVCFRMGNFDPTVTSKSIVVKVRTFEGDKEYTISK